MAPIIEDLERKVSLSLGRDLEVFLYVDDIYVEGYGKPHEEEEE